MNIYIFGNENISFGDFKNYYENVLINIKNENKITEPSMYTLFDKL